MATQRLVSVKVALGRPVSQKPDSITIVSTSSSPQRVPLMTGFSCKDTEHCDAYFILDSETAGYDLKLEPMVDKDCTFDVNLVQAQASSADAEQTIELKIKITTKPGGLSSVGAISPISGAGSILSTGDIDPLTGRPVSQKPDV